MNGLESYTIEDNLENCETLKMFKASNYLKYF